MNAVRRFLARKRKTKLVKVANKAATSLQKTANAVGGAKLCFA